MGFEHVTFYYTLPELDQRLRAAHEERAATFYAAWTAIRQAVPAAVRRLAGSLGRAWRAHDTYRELSTLSDRQLRDIGLHRSEISRVAAAMAAERAGTAITVEDLRRSGNPDPAGSEARIASLPRDDQRQRRPASSTANRQAAAVARHERAAG